MCTGHIGTLMKNDSANAAKSHICTCIGSSSRESSKKSNDGSFAGEMRAYVYARYRIAASMRTLPKNV